ncbi:conserved Plasmodium protein, unknown function [Plasmodium malariae]|uniref:Uncharacterized protein n=1 Tax=Plasmodium malariae TaxID=5858 RepID=A0A1D3JJH5_PLAMA|nr:conserved Plasmodium protein, unknown function [Plasmodium malariae]SBT86651.1 conserved Plasmodium protein, unknown function [Plasmodium malariae]
MREPLDSNKNIFKRTYDDSKITQLMRNISPLFFMSEFLYILFLRYNDYILSTTFKAEVTEDVRKKIYNILILLYFLKPFFAFLTDSVYFNINNILSFLSRKIYEFYSQLQDLLYHCNRAVCNGKYLFLKIVCRKYMKDELLRSKYLKKSSLRKNHYVDNFLYLPLNRKYYVILSELMTTLLLLFIYVFNKKINYYVYLSTIFFISTNMLLTSCVFEGVVVERCRKQTHFEKIFYISYMMCIKIFCSLILYYIYILKVSIFFLILKSFIIFVISCISSEETLLLSNDFKVQRNIILKSENGNINVKNTVDLLSQLRVLRKILFNENLFKILFLIVLFNSSVDMKFSMLQYGVQNYRWPQSLINYIPLVSQSSKLIGIAIFQLYTNKMCYRSYAMITILFNVFLKIVSFIFLYYSETYVSPFLFLLNIIVQNISIKILALPILLLCIEKAPLNLESTIINIYIFCFNLSNLISKRYFIWNIIMHMSKNVFIILLLSFLTTCASLLYYCNISLDSLNTISLSHLYLNDKDAYIDIKLNKSQKKNYFDTNLLFKNKQEKVKSSKKIVRFREESMKIEKYKDDEKKNKTNLFKFSSDNNSDSDQWLIIDNFKGNVRKKYADRSPLNISNMML